MNFTDFRIYLQVDAGGFVLVIALRDDNAGVARSSLMGVIKLGLIKDLLEAGVMGNLDDPGVILELVKGVDKVGFNGNFGVGVIIDFI